jgi:DNA invertase Pin-like site-specific DNA recombinase
MNHKKTVQIYVRVSSSKQERYSPETQRSTLTNWALNLGHLLLEPIIETGSGESIVTRPGIQKVIKLAQEKAFDILAVIEMERIARDETLQDTLLIKSILRENGIQIATPFQTFDLQNVDDDFMSDLLSALSKRERRKIIERSHRGRITAKKQGQYLGEFLPYGYTVKRSIENGKAVSKVDFDEKEKEGLLKLVELAEQNKTTRQIAREISDLGFVTKTGKKIWNKCTVNEILKSTWLYGEAKFFRKKAKLIRGKKQIILYPENEWLIYAVPALLTRERWDLIQEKIQKRRRKKIYKINFNYLFQGLLRCGNCLRRSKKLGVRKECNIGTRRDWYKHTDKNGHTVSEPRYPYYLCSNRVRHQPDWPCDFPQVRSTFVDEKLWDETVKVLRNPKILHDAIVFDSAYDIARKTENQKEIDKIKDKLDKVKEERKRAVRNILTCENISKFEFQEVLKDIDREIETLQQRLKEIENSSVLEKENHQPLPLEDIDLACKALSKSLEEYNFDQKREMVQAIYNEIIIDSDYTVTLNGKIPLDDIGLQSMTSQGMSSTQDLAGAETSGSRSKTAR